MKTNHIMSYILGAAMCIVLCCSWPIYQDTGESNPTFRVYYLTSVDFGEPEPGDIKYTW